MCFFLEGNPSNVSGRVLGNRYNLQADSANERQEAASNAATEEEDDICLVEDSKEEQSLTFRSVLARDVKQPLWRLPRFERVVD